METMLINPNTEMVAVEAADPRSLCPSWRAADETLRFGSVPALTGRYAR